MALLRPNALAANPCARSCCSRRHRPSSVGSCWRYGDARYEAAVWRDTVLTQRAASGVVAWRRERGMGLAEVMICLAIVAVLTAYAMPSYRSHLMRAYRVDAVSALYRAAHFIEQQTADGGMTPPAPSLPNEFAQAPPAGIAIYRVTLASAAVDDGDYALEAMPLPDGPMQADACGTFVLDASGQRANRIDGALQTERVGVCWDGRGGAQ